MAPCSAVCLNKWGCNICSCYNFPLASFILWLRYLSHQRVKSFSSQNTCCGSCRSSKHPPPMHLICKENSVIRKSFVFILMCIRIEGSGKFHFTWKDIYNLFYKGVKLVGRCYPACYRQAQLTSKNQNDGTIYPCLVLVRSATII